MRPEEIVIDEKAIGVSCRTFVIAEIGINHDGDVERAADLIDAAAASGADAVKFQTFRADLLLAGDRDRLAQQGNGRESAREMFRRLELGREAHEKLKARADARGITFLSTPFDEDSADFLDTLGVPAFKIASGDVTHLPLLNRIGSKRKPVLLSTGMADLGEVGEALWGLKSAGAKEIILLHCISSYPAPVESLNLRVIKTLAEQFGLPVGYSDHSLGILMPLAAVAVGACVIEKHFTLDRNAPGPDHKMSADPKEMRELVTAIRAVEAALGDGRKRLTAVEEEGRRLGRRSIVAAVDVCARETIEPRMIAFKRPGTGLPPRDAGKVVGMQARRDLAKDTLLSWDDLFPSTGADGLLGAGASAASVNGTGRELRGGCTHA